MIGTWGGIHHSFFQTKIGGLAHSSKHDQGSNRVHIVTKMMKISGYVMNSVLSVYGLCQCKYMVYTALVVM